MIHAGILFFFGHQYICHAFNSHTQADFDPREKEVCVAFGNSIVGSWLRKEAIDASAVALAAGGERHHETIIFSAYTLFPRPERAILLT